jgi:UDP-N-acetylmuramoyl-L-alanine---L-glutamate ligase
MTSSALDRLRGARRVAIWGFGVEGKAVFEYLGKHFADVQLAILSDHALPQADVDWIAKTAAKPVASIEGNGLLAAAESGGFDLIVKSPGVSLYRPEVAAAKRRSIPITSATNLWFELNGSAKTVVVTGTKGKSTTARLLHHLLVQAGVDALLLGNVGIPALGHDAGRACAVLELSSYQIADLAYAPDLAVVTNLFPEHAPWHGSVETYFRDKLRVLTLGEGTRRICNYADARLRAACAGIGVDWFNIPAGYEVRGGTLLYKGDPVDCASFPLKGEHNLSNLAAACTAADMLGVHASRRRVDLASFRQLRHRLEEVVVGRPPGLLCVNDSISTVPQAAIAALKAYPDRPTILLLGGTDRGQDYAELFDFLPQTRVKAIVLLPPNGARIEAELHGRLLSAEVFRADRFEEGVRQALRRATAGDLLLLSPAAPSFGEFRNFEARGDAFMRLCEAHAELIGDAGSKGGTT